MSENCLTKNGFTDTQHNIINLISKIDSIVSIVT